MHAEPSPFPSDVLIIRYTGLSSSPSVRLELLAAIGQLLGGSKATLSELALESKVADELRVWLASDEASRFWLLEGDRVIARLPCRKHVLVGTRQLLQDLHTYIRRPRQYGLDDLNLVWQAAARIASALD